jgi:HPt (histidine-containing phosphotransfer) domain-containing protein
MTADAIAGVEEQCRSVGINHYISKPFEPEQFVATIWNVIKTLPEKQAKAGKNETTRVIDNAVAVLDENEGIRCLGNNRELYLMVLNEYYQENKEVLTILTNKINEKQYPDAVQIVHKIKSSTGNIGAKRLFAVASELQKSLVNENEPEVFKLLDQFKIEYHQLVDAIIARI